MDPTTRRELDELRAEVARLNRRLTRRRWRGGGRWLGVALVLLLALVPAALGASDRFGDVPEGAFYHDDARAIADAGITLGCGDGSNYCPNANVTRGEMASFLARTAGLGGNPPVANALTAVSAQDAAQLGGVPAGGYLRRDAPDFAVLRSLSLAGPLPRSAQFTSHGGTLLLFVDGSAYATTAGRSLGIRASVDGASVGELFVYANEAGSHKALVGRAMFAPGIGAGTHTVELRAITSSVYATATDANDVFTVTLLELPFACFSNAIACP